MYLTRGQPVVYYGDEQGFVGDGDGDKDARQSLFATQVAEYANQNAARRHDRRLGRPLRHRLARCTTHIAELAALRAATPALQDGAQIERYAPTARSTRSRGSTRPRRSSTWSR